MFLHAGFEAHPSDNQKENRMRLLPLISLILLIVPLWRICMRAGFHGAISLIAIIPLLGPFIVGAILSFGTWDAPRIGRGGQ
jgi:hypothetical protein